MNKPKILIIEDDIALRDLYVKRFELADYEVINASDGEIGIDLAEAISPDAILLDILLPGIDGLKVLSNLRSKDKTKYIPIIVMTAYDLDEYRIKSQPFCDKFFLKSDLRPLDIVNEVNGLINKKPDFDSTI